MVIALDTDREEVHVSVPAGMMTVSPVAAALIAAETSSRDADAAVGMSYGAVPVPSAPETVQTFVEDGAESVAQLSPLPFRER